MSFDINWERLVADEAINESIREFLDDQFKSFSLPSFISGLTVSDFNLGSIPPDIIIRHISDPFDEFYNDNLNNIDDRLRSYLHQSNGSNSDSSSDDEGHEINSTNWSISEDSTFPKFPGDPEIHEDGAHTRKSLESLSLMLGNNNLNFLHNHNLTGLGLGRLGTPTHATTREDTPTKFLQSVRMESSSYLKPKQHVRDKEETDMQFIVEFNYQGNMEIIILVNLLVNYPSPNFISLPIKLHITDLVIHSVAVIAYLKKSAFISFLCDINEQSSPSDYFSSSNHRLESSTTPKQNSGGNFVDYMTNNSTQERIDIIKKVKIESEIGGMGDSVLRNVGKVEKFLVDRLRGLLRDEIAWPSWVCLDLNDDEEEEEDKENIET